MKRFYTTATVSESDDLFHVQLDGRAIRTPAKRPLAVPTAKLAEELAAEWNAQGDDVDRSAMPLNRMAGTAIDGLAGKRRETVDAVANYAGTDMVCYWADHPQNLVERQQATWRPLIDWVAERYDARLHVASGILPISQDETALSALKQAISEMDDFRLVALSVATGAAGSLVIGLALVEGRLGAQGAFDAAQLDESFQLDEWGTDEIAEQRRAALLAEFGHVERFVRALAD
jgi:chaperone required for assembly of F1-ATPase